MSSPRLTTRSGRTWSFICRTNSRVSSAAPVRELAELALPARLGAEVQVRDDADRELARHGPMILMTHAAHRHRRGPRQPARARDRRNPQGARARHGAAHARVDPRGARRRRASPARTWSSSAATGRGRARPLPGVHLRREPRLGAEQHPGLAALRARAPGGGLRLDLRRHRLPGLGREEAPSPRPHDKVLVCDTDWRRRYVDRSQHPETDAEKMRAEGDRVVELSRRIASEQASRRVHRRHQVLRRTGPRELVAAFDDAPAPTGPARRGARGARSRRRTSSISSRRCSSAARPSTASTRTAATWRSTRSEDLATRRDSGGANRRPSEPRMRRGRSPARRREQALRARAKRGEPAPAALERDHAGGRARGAARGRGAERVRQVDHAAHRRGARGAGRGHGAPSPGGR